MLDPVNTLSLIKLSFDVAQVLSKALGTDLVNEPDIFVVLDLIDESCD